MHKKNVTVSAGEIDKFIIRIADFNISFSAIVGSYIQQNGSKDL